MPRNSQFEYDYEEEEEGKIHNFMSGINRFFNRDEYDDEYDDEYEDDNRKEYQKPSRITKVVATKRTVSVWKEVKSIDDAQMVADGLKEGKEQIVNFEKANPADVKDIRFFLCGVTYALDGTATKVSQDVMLFTPRACSVEEGRGIRRKNIFEQK